MGDSQSLSTVAVSHLQSAFQCRRLVVNRQQLPGRTISGSVAAVRWPELPAWQRKRQVIQGAPWAYGPWACGQPIVGAEVLDATRDYSGHMDTCESV